VEKRKILRRLALGDQLQVRLRVARWRPLVTQKVAALKGAVLISVVTRVELEGGVYRKGHCRKRWLLMAEAARPDDRSSSSGAPGNLGSPLTRMTSPRSLVSRRWCGHRSSRGRAPVHPFSGKAERLHAREHSAALSVVTGILG
jgi:hypothetical protein